MAAEPLQFKIHGMDCAEEIAILKREIGPLVGGEERLSFDLLNARMSVAADAEVSAEAIEQQVARTGMRAERWQPGGREEGTFWSRYGRTVLMVSSGLLAALAFALHAWLAGSLAAAVGGELLGAAGAAMATPLAVRAIYLLAILSGGWYIFPKAWFSLVRLRPDMNLLMSLAVAGAIILGQWLEAATVTFLFSLSLVLESWSVGRARRAVAALMDLAPPTVRVRRDGQEQEVSPDDVRVGEVFVVRSGERFPLDGEVISGEGDVNQAPITGESVPVDKRPGDEIFAGTINGDRVLQVRSTKPATQTTLARIIHLVSEAQSRRAPVQQWVEQFAQLYTPAVFGLALAVFLIPPLAWAAPWGEWFYRSLVLLVIGCPCALVISTPVSIVAGLTSAARAGVLVKGGVFLELPARLKMLAFDKTGTLTSGRPQVIDVIPLNGHTEEELLERAAAIEAQSTHPLAQAIVISARERGIAFQPAEDFEKLQGKGATARFDGRPFWLGSHRYLEERGQETPEVHRQLVELSQAGRSVVVVGNEKHVCGLITIADTLRPRARDAVSDLHRMGIDQVAMLTGDNEPTARVIAGELGIAEVHAELLPEDKVQTIESLVSRHGQVGMVGDGVNDAPAMARATLGIAMGAAGSDAAIEAADVALMSDDLGRLPWLIRHSRRTLSVIRQNITFALGIKVLFVILTFAGYASLWAAIAADMGASLAVICNGLRLLQAR